MLFEQQARLFDSFCEKLKLTLGIDGIFMKKTAVLLR